MDGKILAARVDRQVSYYSLILDRSQGLENKALIWRIISEDYTYEITVEVGDDRLSEHAAMGSASLGKSSVHPDGCAQPV